MSVLEIHHPTAGSPRLQAGEDHSTSGDNSLIVSAPTDADLVLEVTAYGQPSRYDLKAQTADHHPSLTREPIVGLNVQMPTQTISLPGNSYTFGWIFDHAIITPYLSDLGPAPEGAAWLLIVDADVSFSASQRFPFDCESYGLTFDFAGTSLTFGDGQVAPVHQLLNDVFDSDGDAFVFQVPNDISEATASIQARYAYDNECGDTGVYEGTIVPLNISFPERRTS
jgi:hypothetical protein